MFGALKDWKSLEIVQRCKEWLEEANALHRPTTFIAYMGRTPSGLIEFVLHRLMKTLGLMPCRRDPEKGEVEGRYSLEENSENCLFISCLWVRKDCRGRGIGRSLLDHLLSSEAFRMSNGLLVYAKRRDESWDKHIHWPAGSKEFYVKAGFQVERTLDNPAGYLLCYRNPHV